MLRHCRRINMLALFLVPLYQSFAEHVLQKFERGGIANFCIAVEFFVNTSNSARTFLPENLEDVQLGLGWRRRRHVDELSIRRASYSVQNSLRNPGQRCPGPFLLNTIKSQIPRREAIQALATYENIVLIATQLYSEHAVW